MSLSSLSGLKFLSLSSVTLFKSSFVNLTHLRKLHLIDCDFKKVTSDTFRDLKSLVVFTNEHGKNCQHLSYASLSQLKWLIVSCSKLEASSLNQELAVLELFRIETEEVITRIVGELERPSKLRALNIIDFDFGRTFNAESLSSLSASLEFLKIQECQLQTINWNSAFPKLRSIDFATNNVSFIEANFFKGLDKLETINLFDNRIKTLDKAA